MNSKQTQMLTLKRLKRQSLFLGLTSIVLAIGVFHRIRLTELWDDPEYQTRWLVICVSVLLVEHLILWQNLEHNRPDPDSALYKDLGWANIISMVRGFMLAGMAGFLFSPWPLTSTAWLPGILYITAAVIDLFDGYIARATGHPSKLGEILDVELDALGILIAPLLAVWYSQLPWWYLSVSVARYLFIGHAWFLKKTGKPIYPLPPSPARRIYAGTQMGFIGAVLLPFLGPPMTFVAAGAFMTPFLLTFIRDWLIVVGAINADSSRYQSTMRWITGLLLSWLPILLRGLIIVASLLLIAGLMNDRGGVIAELEGIGLSDSGSILIFFVVLIASAGFSIFLGILGRSMSIVLMIAAIPFARVLGIVNLPLILLTIGAILILQLGSGKWVLWSPEDRFFNYRIANEQE